MVYGKGCQVKACSRETYSLSWASKIYGHKAFQIIHLHATVISGRAALLNTAHTVGVRCGLASALTAATILADATVTSTVSEMTYNVLSGTLNHTQPTSMGVWRHSRGIFFGNVTLLNSFFVHFGMQFQFNK